MTMSLRQTNLKLPGIIPKDRIRTRCVRRPPASFISRFLQLEDMAGLVARVLDRLGVAGAIPAHELRPLAAGQKCVGPAITVRNVPDRLVPYRKWERREPSYLGEREAYFVAQPGDVIVIDNGGRMAASSMGGQSARAARDRGLAGSIVDGPVTGVQEIVTVGYPVWARGATTITGHHRVETSEINGVVSCGSVQVRPGDLVVADDQGVAIVPVSLVADVWRICQEQASLARTVRRESQKGSPDAAQMKRFMQQVAERK